MQESRTYWIREDPRGLWRRWLASAPTDARAIRRWRIWVWWTRPRSPGQRARLIANQLLVPLIAVRDSARAVRIYGRDVAKRHGISRIRQFLGALRFRFRSGMEPLSYYRYRLFLPDRRVVADDFLDVTGELTQILVHRQRDVRQWDMLVEDKVAFGNWCEEKDLPRASTIVEIRGDDVTWHQGSPLPSGDLFLKPLDWTLGRGVELLRHVMTDGVSSWSPSDGVVRTETALIGYMKERSRDLGRPMLLQPRLVNHPDIGALGNGALCTLRMMTLHPHHGDPEFFQGFLRIARGRAVADNFDQGSFVSPIHSGTGTLGKAVSRLEGRINPPVAVNPENGATIEGVRVPFWDEAVRLVVRAHGALGFRVPLVGWDVAIVAEGPLLIEGNGLPGHQGSQKPTGLPLGRSPMARVIRESLEEEFSVQGRKRPLRSRGKGADR